MIARSIAYITNIMTTILPVYCYTLYTRDRVISVCMHLYYTKYTVDQGFSTVGRDPQVGSETLPRSSRECYDNDQFSLFH